jgi:peptidoglycan hydrolase-like protein with peptidoglycan-binding domain
MHATRAHRRSSTLLTLAALLPGLLLGAALAGPSTTASAQTGTSYSVSDPATEVLLRPGDRAWRVRVLQSRLHQIGLHSEVVHNRFDAETRRGVQRFQSRRKEGRRDGIVDRLTWQRLLARTKEPTHDALHNVYQPGPALLSRGDQGMWVRQVQARLEQVRWYAGKVTGHYDAATVKAVKGFQAKRAIPVTGEVDRRTLDRLKAMTRKPTKAELFNIVAPGAPLDPRCRTGRAMCVDKTSRSLRWVVDGVVLKTVEVRFGSAELPTREGAFAVFRKSRDHVSSLYHTSMPYAMFFSGGQAVHYSPDFAANGYNGASHGCVNVRDRAAVAWLFDQVHLGDKVIVYRS